MRQDSGTRSFVSLSNSDMAALKDIQYDDVNVTSDLVFSWQADGSRNPSQLQVWYPNKGAEVSIQVNMSSNIFNCGQWCHKEE